MLHKVIVYNVCYSGLWPSCWRIWSFLCVRCPIMGRMSCQLSSPTPIEKDRSSRENRTFWHRYTSNFTLWCLNAPIQTLEHYACITMYAKIWFSNQLMIISRSAVYLVCVSVCFVRSLGFWKRHLQKVKRGPYWNWRIWVISAMHPLNTCCSSATGYCATRNRTIARTRQEGKKTQPVYPCIQSGFIWVVLQVLLQISVYFYSSVSLPSCLHIYLFILFYCSRLNV